MGLHIVRLPDVGEGIAEAELVEWHVALGDHVAPDAHLADVLTDKATIEISSPVAGVISFLGGEPGDLLAIGSDFVGIDVDGAGNAAGQRRSTAAPTVVEQSVPPAEPSLPSVSQQTPGSGQRGDTDQRDPDAAESVSQQTPGSGQRGDTDPSLETASTASTASTAEPSRVVPSRIVPVKPVAAPAVRLRAGDLGVDLRQVRGTGPANRITHADLDLFVTGGVAATR
ncbi:MAG: biotin/lipoyl-containing protein, partial [Ilumatobacteraceae bacterium]